MSPSSPDYQQIVSALQERAKELNCLYRMEEILSHSDRKPEQVYLELVAALPAGWQYPDICEARLELGGSVYETTPEPATEWALCSRLVVQEEEVGNLCVFYTQERSPVDEGPFLKEERKLIDTIADRIEHYLLHQQLKSVFESRKQDGRRMQNWRIVLDLLKGTDPRLLMRISRKMTNYLCREGIPEADRLLGAFGGDAAGDPGDGDDPNRPQTRRRMERVDISQEVFDLAARHLSETEIYGNIQKWIKEEKSEFLVNLLQHPGTTLADLTAAMERFFHMEAEAPELPVFREKGLRVALVRRVLSDHPDYINIAKNYISLRDFYDLLGRVIYPAGILGRLGGKGAGLCLAEHVLRKHAAQNDVLKDIRTPRTWYLTSDAILHFMQYNNLEEVSEQKYKEIGTVRQEYPHIVQLFKNSQFPPEIIQGLSMALDDLGDGPIIVRSSSLLEDRLGTAFAGKYKSLFLANQGGKRERLDALKDAIAEVYASTFGPDPIEYRVERGLVDFHEEMGVLIQEVIGTQVGRYFLPAYSGVGFSQNEYRWSGRIRREDGLLRMVPGLGTRAVDRLSDDYPVLISPGQPNLPVNVTLDEKIRYSPKKIDLINLDENRFETRDIRDLLGEVGDQLPATHLVLSFLEQDRLRQPGIMDHEYGKRPTVVSFDGLFSRTEFIKKVDTILTTLEQVLETPVDIEFSSDGENFYLLQCRPQSYSEESLPAEIPHSIAPEHLLFTANRYIASGTVPNISHVVFINPDAYSELGSRGDMLAVGRAVSRLNQVLPKRRFVLMGPGRWGSRGDITLGVSVTYSDINNAAMLIEVARQKGSYLPELSFGTHFFQDLVESGIRYLPLYPDDSEIRFNWSFFQESPNMLERLLPDFAHLEKVVRVIDVARSSDGLNLHVLMNGEAGDAVGMLDARTTQTETRATRPSFPRQRQTMEDHWHWRMRMAERIAEQIEPERFGVEALYIFGSTKNATAGAASDIDLLVHIRSSAAQRRELEAWLRGWSLCLAEINYQRTGVVTEGLLDVHLITDADIERRSSYAVKIGAVSDPARPLTMAGKR